MKLTKVQKDELKQLAIDTKAATKAKREKAFFEAKKKKVVAKASKVKEFDDLETFAKKVVKGGKKVRKTVKKRIAKAATKAPAKPPKSFDLLEGFGQDVGVGGMRPPQGMGGSARRKIPPAESRNMFEDAFMVGFGSDRKRGKK